METLQSYKHSNVQDMGRFKQTECQQPKKTQWSAASSGNWSFLQWTTQTALTPINYVRFTSQISTCPLNSEGALSNYDNDLQKHPMKFPTRGRKN